MQRDSLTLPLLYLLIVNIPGRKLSRETKKANSALQHVRTNSRSMMSEECFNSFMTEAPIIYFVLVICENFRFDSVN